MADKFLLATLGAFGQPFLGWTRYSDFKKDKDKVALATLDVHNYSPDEITLKVDDGKVKVEGMHRSEGQFGFATSEFHQAYPLPEDIDPSSVSSRFSPDGILHIEAYKKPKETKTVAPTTEMDDQKFKVRLNLKSFSPDEVKVRVFNNELMVNASQNIKSETDDGLLISRQFCRHFVLPKDVDMDSIASKLDKDGNLYIEGTRKQVPQPAVREIEVVKPDRSEEAEK